MKSKEKPQYTVLQNMNYTARLAWKHSRLLVIMAIAASILSLATSLVQLYIELQGLVFRLKCHQQSTLMFLV